MPGSILDAAVYKHFKYSSIVSQKRQYTTCLRCQKWSNAQNTTRQKMHLLRCPGYLEWKKANNVPTEKGEQTNLLKFKAPMDPAKKDRIDAKIAHAIYVTGKPFTLFEDPVWQDVFNEFNYTPPSAFR